MLRFSVARLFPLATVVAFAALAVGGAAPAHGSSFTVNATHDAVDASPGDGVCADAGGACTLRAAVMETNALAGADEISLPAGTYVLSMPGAGEDAGATGDLDITDDVALTAPVIVNGTSEPGAIVDGAGLDRVFHVLPAASGRIFGVVVQNGSADVGGGIHNEGILRLNTSIVRANEAPAPSGCPGLCAAPEGGGISNLGELEADDVAIIDNLAFVGGGVVNDGSVSLNRSSLRDNNATSEGGAISNFGTVSVSDTSIIGNVAGSTGGAIDNNAGDLNIARSTLADNQSNYGGALFNQATSELTNVTISGNSAVINGGGIVNNGSPYTTTAIHVTNADNEGSIGGGIYNSNVEGLGEPGLVGLVTTIVALNRSGGDCSGPITSLGNNIDYGWHLQRRRLKHRSFNRTPRG